MSVLVGRQAPDFKADAVVNGDFREIRLSEYRGKYVVLFFYPADFTFVCPTELHAFQEKMEEFRRQNVEVLSCSTDSKFVHFAWWSTPKNKGGIQGVSYPLVADVKKTIARDYDVLSDDGMAYRGLFLIDKNGIVRHQIVNDMPLGRNVDEVLRMVASLQHFEQNGEVCPANWTKGGDAMKPTPEGVSSYLSKH